MRAELLRPSRLKKTEDHQRTTTSAIEVDEHQSDQVNFLLSLNSRSFSFFSQKPSKTIEEQIIPSNFIRSLNESKIRDFLAAQDALPPKLRFRRGAVTNFFTLIIENLQCNLQSNAYFLSLPDHDRQILFRRTRRYPAILALILIFRHYHLFDNQCFYNSVEHIFGSQATFAIKCAIDQLDSDEIFIQIILTALIFSTISTTTESTYFTDLKSLLSIEEIYTDISWRYISYRYGYDDAVVRFSQLVRCLLTVNTIIMEAQTSPEYTQMINLILEHKLCL